jgi:ribonuclease-3
MTLVDFANRWNFPTDSVYLRAALTHRSAAATINEGNERLEFLGDALLSAFVARYLMESLPPETGEAELSRARVTVIRKETLAEAARNMGVSELLQVGLGERKENRHTQDTLLADAFEALIAAIYFERGQVAMETFLRATLADVLAEVCANPTAPDPKTELQIRLQAIGRGLPIYNTVSEEGTGHEHHFVVEVVDNAGQVLGRGEGRNKRTAQRLAAENALTTFLPRAGE